MPSSERIFLFSRATRMLISVLAMGLLLVISAVEPAHVLLATTPVASSGWLDRLNAWRAGSGTSTLSENTTWSAGDSAHAMYMVQTGQVTHGESTAYAQYTTAGDIAGQNSNIYVSSTTSTSDVTAIDWWMGAPFHAMAMVDPRLTTTGFGSYRSSSYSPWQMGAALDVGQGLTAPGRYPVFFPGNGSTEPLTTFSGNESPDPTQACPGYRGLPLFIEVGGNVATTAGPIHSLTGNGALLAHCIIDSTNPTFTNNLKWRGGVIVFPQQPLQNGVTYTVALTVNSLPYTWSFTVGSTIAAAPPTGPPSIVPLASTPSAANLHREIFGFALASSLSDPTVGYPSWNFSLLSTVAFFGLHVQDDGTFAADSGATVWNSSQLTNLVNAAHSHGSKVVLTIVLQDFSAGTPHMCAGLARGATTVSRAVAEMKAKGVDGINMDYEGLNGSCGTSDGAWARHQFTNVVAYMRSQMPAGSYLSVDTYASSSVDPAGFFDVPNLAPHLDSFFVMAYDLDWSNYGRAPATCSSYCMNPVAPLGGYYYNDTNTAAQYKAVAPASKIILGVPYYGRVACVSAATPNATMVSSFASPSYLDASTESTSPAVQAGSYVTHRDANDPAGMERWDTWFNTTLNCTRELYWDDVTSLGLKYDLVNNADLRGVGMWNLNLGGGAPELWNLLATKFAVPGTPGSVAAYSENASAAVSWSPATSQDGPILSYTVTASPGGATATVQGSAKSALIYGLTNGASYTFTVAATNSYGAGTASAPSNAIVPAVPAMSAAFPWYDFATPGFQSDYFAVANSGTSFANVLIVLPGATPLSFGVPKGSAKYVSLPPGSIGGPVLVSADSPVLVSQRAVYAQSFAERAAVPTSALATSLTFPWYDWSTPGFGSDYFYVSNPGGTAANVTISLPGATSLTLSVGPGSAAFKTFPHGTIGGPVKLTSDQPVTASQRVLYGNSFSEIPASLPTNAATSLIFPWYDWASPDFGSDYFYVANPGATAANVTISLPGAPPLHVAVGAGGATYRTFPHGTVGGPVTVSSDLPVLVSQRSLFDGNFTEVAASLASSQATSFHFPWYDWSNPDLQSDYFYVANPGPNWANILISIPGQPVLSFGVPRGTTKAMTFPRGAIGGPVTVTTDGPPVLISQRVVFDSMFQEFTAPPGS